MKFVEQNRLELIYVVLVDEEYLTTTLALLSNQNHKNAFKIFSVKIIYEEIFKKNFLDCYNMCA